MFNVTVLSRRIYATFRKNIKINKHGYCTTKRNIIMGIETSCDDTGCAILDIEGNILGEALNSQLLVHIK